MSTMLVASSWLCQDHYQGSPELGVPDSYTPLGGTCSLAWFLWCLLR